MKHLTSYSRLFNYIWASFEPGYEVLTLHFEQYEHYIREEIVFKALIGPALGIGNSERTK